MEIEVKVAGLMPSPTTGNPIIVLREQNGEELFFMAIGHYEANAVALEIENILIHRPMTHDLLKNILVGLDALPQKVVVNEYNDQIDTFYAIIWLKDKDRPVPVDSQPSDAIALALRANCPIYVEKEAFDKAQKIRQNKQDDESEELRLWLAGLDDDDLKHA